MLTIKTRLTNGAVCGLVGRAGTLQTYVGDPIELHLRMDIQVVSEVALLGFIETHLETDALKCNNNKLWRYTTHV